MSFLLKRMSFVQRKNSEGIDSTTSSLSPRRTVANGSPSSNHNILAGRETISKVKQLPSEFKNLTISHLLESDLAFSHLITFAKTSHCCEFLFFWCASVAFHDIGVSNSWESKRKRTESFEAMEARDYKDAQRNGLSYPQAKAMREAYAIYDRFIAKDSPSWAVLPPTIVAQIEKVLEDIRTAIKKGKPVSIPYTLFDRASQYAFDNLSQDLLPRYLASLVRTNNVAMINYIATLIPDAAEEKLQQQEEEEEEVVEQVSDEGKISTINDEIKANIFLALYPSPQALFESRPDAVFKEPISESGVQETLKSMKVMLREDRGVSIFAES